ncbi:MAG: universal stress protein [Desulfobacteraceae bacterium]|nr:MAG: universal stress protein [Desulfobacteraceae bacterium]
MQNKINNILACVDLSAYSLMVLEYAFEISNNTDARIIILNIINQKEIYAIEKPFGIFPSYISQGLSVDKMIRKLKEHRHQEIDQMIHDHFLNYNSTIDIKIDTGLPIERILAAIDIFDIDVIVIANKGKSDFSKILFGSTAEKVLRHSSVPVFSVRDKTIFKTKSLRR